MTPSQIARRAGRSLLVLLALVTPLAGSPPATADGTGRYYAQTGHTLAAPFVAYFDAHGGLPIFGLPLAEAEQEGGYQVQYLERARLEYHPENRPPYDVLLGRLGATLTAGRAFAPAPAAEGAPGPDRRWFPETRHTLRGVFRRYWEGHGGLAQFGYPLSEQLAEPDPATGRTYQVQYFERARFEAHPENAAPYDVLLGLLGRDLLARRVQLSTAEVTLPTYDYEAGFVSPAPDRPGAYPGLDFAAVGLARPRAYHLIVLENRYLRLTVLPDLGGRLYEVIYKPTGHNELYHNPVVKPAPFGARGWWLGVGGTEWAFPTDEHGLLEYLPWAATTSRDGEGGVSVRLTATDRQTGLRGTGTIHLASDEAAYTLSISLTNPTPAPQQTQLWINTMLAPGGGNQVPPASTWWLPGTSLVVHSTDDPDLGPAGRRLAWPQPMSGGRSLADYRTWQHYLGGFIPPDARTGDAAALYNRQADEGMVRIGPPPGVAQGLKLFGFGPHFDPHIYTDDSSSYAELWGGLLPTFADTTLLPPGATVGWSERWQPVAGLGGVGAASGWGAAALRDDIVRLAPLRLSTGTVILRRAGNEVARRSFTTGPDAPLALPVPGAGPVTLEVRDEAGTVVLQGPLVPETP
jgi:hypothetical protein